MFLKLINFLKAFYKPIPISHTTPIIPEEIIMEDSKKTYKIQFSARSQEKLEKAHPDLQALAMEILQEMDITVLCTYRGEAEQNEAFKAGNSTLKYPQSKHNQIPSLAIDLAPYPIDWLNIKRFENMLQIANIKAQKLGIKLRYGRDFSFKDYPHIELLKPSSRD